MHHFNLRMLSVILVTLSLSFACETEEEDNQDTAGMMTAGEAAGEAAGITAGEAAGMTAAGEAAGMTAAGEVAGMTAAGEAAGMTAAGDRISAEEFAGKINRLFYAAQAGQERLCEACPEDSYCEEGEGDVPFSNDDASCILDNLNDEQITLVETFFDCQAQQVTAFEACTAEPICDDSYFDCLDALVDDEACAPEGSPDIDAALPDIDVVCFGATECSDGSGSYTEDSLCDGFDDCEDGSDEAGCE